MRTNIEQFVIDQVKKRRKTMKVSQEKLAYAIGFESKGYIGAIESNNPERTETYNINHLNEIARILKCSPKDFWPEMPL